MGWMLSYTKDLFEGSSLNVDQMGCHFYAGPMVLDVAGRGLRMFSNPGITFAGSVSEQAPFQRINVDRGIWECVSFFFRQP